MDSLTGQKLLRKSGAVISADEALEGKKVCLLLTNLFTFYFLSTFYFAYFCLLLFKIILFYFSAHWNPACGVFTPTLADFYQVPEVFWTNTLYDDCIAPEWWSLCGPSPLGPTLPGLLIETLC